MNAQQFKLPIGAKRQVTLPRAFLEMLSLREGGELLLETDGRSATLTPMVSVPRSVLPEELRREFEARRGSKSTDIPLVDFLAEIDQTPSVHGGVAKDKDRAAVSQGGDVRGRSGAVRRVAQLGDKAQGA